MNTLSQELVQQVAAYIDAYFEPIQPKRSYRMASCQAQRLESCREMCMPALSLEDVLRQQDAGFTQTLLRLIDQSGKSDPQIYKKANLSKQHFSKIRKNPDYKPTKPTAIALALALELDLEDTKDLIGRAGYALSNSSKFDLIIRFFIEKRSYDLQQINQILYQFDQPLLGV